MQNQATEHLLFSVSSLQSLTKGYILTCRTEGKSAKTISGYQMVLNNFSWFCQNNQYPDVQKLTPIHVRNFLWYLASEPNRWNSTSPAVKKPASQTTVNHYYRALRTFFNWLYKEQLIPQNPFDHLKTPKIQKKVIQALSAKDIEQLFEECSGKSAIDVRNKAIVCTFLDTGLRVSELADLNIDDIDFDTGSILVRHGKGNKQRIVRVGSRAQNALWRYLTIRATDNKRLFMNRNNQPLDVRGIKILIKRLGVRAKIKLHPHQLRHTFAVSFLRSGSDVFSLQYLLGHSTLSMTQRYLQSLNANDAINAHKKFSPLDNLNRY